MKILLKTFAVFVCLCVIFSFVFPKQTVEFFTMCENKLIKKKDFFNKPDSYQTSHIKIYKKERELELYCDDSLVGFYKIGLGGSPIGDKNEEGDKKTPVGRYYICTRTENTDFTLFMGISYPNIEDAERNKEKISQAEYNQIKNSITNKTLPPWNTPLGGAVGIHGGNTNYDLTLGCIAVSNEAVKQIWDFTDYKTPVDIYESRLQDGSP